MAHRRMVERLKAVAEVTAKVGSGDAARIYPVLRHAGEDLPAITYQRIGTVPVNHSTGTTDTAWARIQLNCLAGTYDAAVDLSAAVQAALSGWSDLGGTPAVSMCHLLDMGDLPEDLLPGQEVREYAIRHDYLLQYS